MTNLNRKAANLRRDIHEALVLLPAPEADRVRTLIQRLEAAAASDAWMYAAAVCEKAGGLYSKIGNENSAGTAFALMDSFLRKSGEVDYAATPCSSPVACEDGGEPCDTHERLMGHIEGDHELCPPDCGAEWIRRLAETT